MSYDGYPKEDAYYEIYDEDLNLVDSGHPNHFDNLIFVSENLSEGQYYGIIYYDEDDMELQISSFYSYGNSSGNSSNVINVEMALMEDENLSLIHI